MPGDVGRRQAGPHSLAFFRQLRRKSDQEYDIVESELTATGELASNET